MARWTASAKWAAGPALDGQCGMPLAIRLSERFHGLGGEGEEAGTQVFVMAFIQAKLLAEAGTVSLD